MSRVCQITGKRAMGGNHVSHSKRRVKRTFSINLFKRNFYWPEEDRWIRLNVSAEGLRLINKIGWVLAWNRLPKPVWLKPFKITDEGTERSRKQSTGDSWMHGTERVRRTGNVTLHYHEEQEEYAWEIGIEKVQSLFEKSNVTPRN